MGVTLTCNRCKEEKAFKDFYKNTFTKTGKSTHCKECIKEKMRVYYGANKEASCATKNAWYAKNKESARKKIYAWKAQNPKYMVHWHAQNREKHAKNVKAWRARHPHYVECHKEYNLAIRSGMLIKPENCMLCNKEGKVEGHHHNYSKPLDVVWVCTKCHRDIHAKHRLIDVK